MTKTYHQLEVLDLRDYRLKRGIGCMEFVVLTKINF